MVNYNYVNCRRF